MDKKILLILFILIAIAALAAYAQGIFNQRTLAAAGGSSVRIGKNTYMVELAVTPSAQAQGLSDREELLAGRGMLFVFDPPRSEVFWMKGMRFPIDIIWIKEGAVVGLVENAAIPKGLRMPTFSSPGPIDRVLELPAGTVSRDGIVIGAEVIF